jgi:hypothetical protein
VAEALPTANRRAFSVIALTAVNSVFGIRAGSGAMNASEIFYLWDFGVPL